MRKIIYVVNFPGNFKSCTKLGINHLVLEAENFVPVSESYHLKWSLENCSHVWNSKFKMAAEPSPSDISVTLSRICCKKPTINLFKWSSDFDPAATHKDWPPFEWSRVMRFEMTMNFFGHVWNSRWSDHSNFQAVEATTIVAWDWSWMNTFYVFSMGDNPFLVTRHLQSMGLHINN